MTIDDLEQVYKLKKERCVIKDELNELRSRCEPASPALGNNGHSSTPSSPLERDLEKRLELSERLNRNDLQQIERITEIENYLDTVGDIEMRVIIRSRFILCRSWRRVAMDVGGGNTEDSVRMYCKRFFEKLESCSECSV